MRAALSVSNEAQTLMKLGLTANQARAYLSLNTMGTSEAKSIIQTTKIPRQDIYRILDELFEKGLVEKFVSKPIKFRAISPTNCLKLLVQRRKNETEKLKEEASIVFNAFNRTEKERKTGSGTLLVSPQNQTLLKCAELIASLKKSMFVLSPPQKLFPWIFAHQKLLKKAVRRNVMLRFITTKTEGETFPEFFGHSRRGSLLETRFVSQLSSLCFGVYDDRTVILALSGDNGYSESKALVSDIECLVEMAKVCFESMWMQSEN